MDQYNDAAYRFARELTLQYSSSFGLASRLFGAHIRPHIYAIYALVRIADEIVDTYKGHDADVILDELESDIYRAIRTGYSANLIVQAFTLTVRRYNINPALIKAFYRSMRLDLTDTTYTPKLYLDYIHGSAEAVGLMCLAVFCESDTALHNRLQAGAAALGAAYQKVNFLRDAAADYQERGRVYFPGHSFDDFDEAAKRAVIHDTTLDFDTAREAINQLPNTSQTAVRISYVLYRRLLDKLRAATIGEIKQSRIRISGLEKLWLACTAIARGRV